MGLCAIEFTARCAQDAEIAEGRLELFGLALRRRKAKLATTCGQLPFHREAARRFSVAGLSPATEKTETSAAFAALQYETLIR
jgi:hypothetical protein